MNDATDRLLATIQGFAEPLLTDIGMELVEIQFRREGYGWVLRFFIDKEGGISIDMGRMNRVVEVNAADLDVLATLARLVDQLGSGPSGGVSAARELLEFVAAQGAGLAVTPYAFGGTLAGNLNLVKLGDGVAQEGLVAPGLLRLPPDGRFLTAASADRPASSLLATRYSLLATTTHHARPAQLLPSA